MPWGFAAAAAGTIGSALIGANATTTAANDQSAAAQEQLQLERNIFQQTTANEKPYLAAGGTSLAALMQGLGLAPGGTPGNPNAGLIQPFTAKNFQTSPGYNFQLQQGGQAINNAASAQGGVGGGNNLKSLLTYGQGVANQDWYNALNAYQQNQNNVFSKLNSVAGAGQNAAANLGGFGQQYAAGASSALAGIGNAGAAGAIGQGQNLANLFNNPSLQSLFQSGIGSLFGTGSNTGYGGVGLGQIDSSGNITGSTGIF